MTTMIQSRADRRAAVLVVPLAAIAITLLYGNARAAHDQTHARPSEQAVPAAADG